MKPKFINSVLFVLTLLSCSSDDDDPVLTMDAEIIDFGCNFFIRPLDSTEETYFFAEIPEKLRVNETRVTVQYTEMTTVYICSGFFRPEEINIISINEINQ